MQAGQINQDSCKVRTLASNLQFCLLKGHVDSRRNNVDDVQPETVQRQHPQTKALRWAQCDACNTWRALDAGGYKQLQVICTQVCIHVQSCARGGACKQPECRYALTF